MFPVGDDSSDIIITYCVPNPFYLIENISAFFFHNGLTGTRVYSVHFLSCQRKY